MMHELVLKFEPSVGIAATEIGFSKEAVTGLIQLVVCSSSEKEGELLLLSVKWNLQELIHWFRENAMAIAEEPLPEFVAWNGSISASVERFYDDVNIEEDEKIDRVFEYRQRHELCFALRGVDIPSIYVGCGENGEEISGEVEGKRFNFSVNLTQFLSRLTTQRPDPGD